MQKKDIVRFVNLRLEISKFEFGIVTLLGYADGIEVLKKSTNEKQAIKLNINDGK